MSAAADERQARIEELARRLADTEAELQALTGGVDAVLDRERAAPVLLRETQRALQASEARYRRLVGRISALILELTPEGRIEFVNEAAAGVLGYAPGELLRRRWQSALLAGVPPGEVEALEAELRHGDVTRRELTLLARGGKPVVVELNSANRYDEQGKLERIVLLAIDVTARKQAETALQEANESLERQVKERTRWLAAANDRLAIYRSMAEQSPDGFLVVDRQHRFVLVNPAYAGLSGLEPDDLVGHTPAAVIGEQRYAEVVAPYYERVFGRGDYVTNEDWFEYAQAGRRYMEVRYFPIVGDEREVEYVGVILHDATERKRAEEWRERALAELDATITHLPAGIVIYDTEGRAVRMNPQAREIMGWGEEDWQRPLDERVVRMAMLDAEGQPMAAEAMPVSRASRGEVVQGAVLQMKRPEGRRVWLSASAAPIVLPDGRVTGVVAAFIDITGMRELQQQQETFVHMVSHDLRAPLTIINGHAQLVAALVGGEPRLAQSAQIITQSVRRMDVMIQDMVDAARLEGRQLRLRRQPLDLAEFLRDFLPRAAEILQAGRVHVRLPAGLPPLWVDRDRFERVITNLLSNALKYSPPAAEVEVTARPDDSHVVVAVRDRGQGISPEALPHIFDRFYRAGESRKAEGLGLGLYITRLLVEAHRGQVWAESEPGRGSTFYVRLPRAK